MSSKLAPRLSNEKQKLMSLLLAEVGLGRRQRIQPRGDLERVPLSFAQQRLWFLDQLDPGNPQYNTPIGAAINGPLNVRILEQTIAEIVKRHEALRTILPVVDGQPVQQIIPSLDITMPVIDLTHVPLSERREHALRIRDDEASVSFDLATGPLVRAVLLRLAEEDHWLLLMTHHVVFDSWSVGIFSKELALVYSALVEGSQPSLPELEIQYADFAVWQRQWLQGKVLDEQLDFWMRNLESAAPVLQLPTDHPRPAVQTFRGRIEGIRLSIELTRTLREMSRKEDVTLYMIFLTVFKILLFRYSNQEDIIVSGGVARRNRSELENLIGCFINILLFRTDLSGDPTFLELLRRVEQVTLDVYAHQDLPFEKIVAALHPTRDLSFNPLTQVMIVLHNSARPVSEFKGLKLTPIGTPEKQVAQYDLLLHIYDRPMEPKIGLHGILEYNTDLFDPSTARRLLENFKALLEDAVANPTRRISELNVVQNEERKLLLHDWNDTAWPFARDVCVVELFEEQVVRTPDAIAAVFEDRQLTYRELNSRANRLAHYLITKNVRPEVLVGLLAERNLDYLTALIAIHKAGGAFIPLDPRNPAARLAQVLEFCETPLVLAGDEYLSLVQQAAGNLGGKSPAVIPLRDALAQESDDENPVSRVTLDNLAYVIFTSGSTGTPKGAMIEHRGMLNHVSAKIADLRLSDSERLAQNSPQSFDVMIWQFLAALTVGGRVQIFNNEAAYNPVRLLEEVDREGVTILQLVPALLKTMVQEAESKGEARPQLNSLRWIVPTGEALPTSLCRRWFKLYPAIPMLNNCGATECSDDYCHHSITGPAQLDHALPVMPIGRPISNVRTYVLDGKLQPVPVGVVGELHASGYCLGRGYLKDPARTAETFIPDIFACTPGARLYRSKDQVRHLADGVIEIRGRVDQMVKVRGFQVEVSEVEATLSLHPAVRDCLVLARDDERGGKRLVAYVVPRTNQPQTAIEDRLAPELRAHLKEHLPEYMIPSDFVLLDEMPLSANGKIDRQALPVPDASRPAQAQVYAAPESALEEDLWKIWIEVLGRAEIGVNDNFFDLGGDSFSIINIIQRLERPVTLVDFMKNPTIRALAEHLSTNGIEETSLLHRLTRRYNEEAPALVCIPYGGGNVVVYQPLAQALDDEFVVYAVALPGHDIGHGEEELRPLEEIAATCTEEITARINGPLFLYGHCAGAALAAEIARRLENMDADLRGVYIGGAFPAYVGRIRKALLQWRRVRRFGTDEKIFDYIRSIGGIDGSAGSRETDFVANAFRHDGECANEYFRLAHRVWGRRRLRAPIVCLIGDADPLTRDFEVRYKSWHRFSQSVELVIIKGGGHYFVKQQADEVAGVIRDRE
jgi:amino acid adenylation domain-containing protein